MTAACVCVQMGEVQYEERIYPAGYWACVTREESLYEQSISMGFMKLMRFICKENSAGQTPPTQGTHTHTPALAPPMLVFTYVDSTHTTGHDKMEPALVLLHGLRVGHVMSVLLLLVRAGRFLGMTIPVISNVLLTEDGNTFKKDVETTFFLPAQFQTNPPQPSDPDIRILYREPMRIIAR